MLLALVILRTSRTLVWRRDCDRFLDHAALEFLDLENLTRLLLEGHVLMDDAMPPSCASVMARRASVTVSMAADTSGVFEG